MIHVPSFSPQKARDPHIGISPVLAGQSRDPGAEAIFLYIRPGKSASASIVAAPRPRTLCALIPVVPLAHGRLPGVSLPGSEVSPGRLLQDRLIQDQIGDEFLESRVLLFQLLQPIGLVYPQTAEFLPPSVVSLVRDPKP